MTTTDDGFRVPDACTLPTPEQPLRVAEFDALFSSSLRSQVRQAPTRVRWTFDRGAEAQVRDLAARESACCSFFTFTITPADAVLAVDVEVPGAHVDVLEALGRRAAAGLASHG